MSAGRNQLDRICGNAPEGRTLIWRISGLISKGKAIARTPAGQRGGGGTLVMTEDGFR